MTGQIGHTQPRRIAARTVAERIASELGTELGGTVGYQVRFTDTSSDGTLVKVMTDGILLAEMQRDRQLLRYDTLIIDEAHERSLNIDFILGYLKRLLPRRPDLKVIITSATIDPQRFSEHFKEFGAPVIEVSGRTYPVEVRYRPLADPDDPDEEPKDQVQGICDAVAELSAEGPGDILVFLSGEREIRDTADALDGRDGLEVLPLYARLSAAEQHRVFQPHGQARRVVLATNVAETSLTVPGIKYVIDPGTARISRYSQRTKVQRLPIEPISQASANQRKGRCGRTSDGVCIRLYSEEDFESRARSSPTRRSCAPTWPRSSCRWRRSTWATWRTSRSSTRRTRGTSPTASGCWRSSAPSPSRARPGPARLTDVGRKLARLPGGPAAGPDDPGGRPERLCPRGADHHRGAVHQGPAGAARGRPAGGGRACTRASPSPAPTSWPCSTCGTTCGDQQRELSASAFRRMCRREYLHYLRVREWQDVYGQLRQAAADLGIGAGRARGRRRGAPRRQPARAAAHGTRRAR